MTPQQALDFLASSAQQVLPIARLNDYNAAVEALKATIAKAAGQKPAEDGAQ